MSNAMSHEPHASKHDRGHTLCACGRRYYVDCQSTMVADLSGELVDLQGELDFLRLSVRSFLAEPCQHKPDEASTCEKARLARALGSALGKEAA